MIVAPSKLRSLTRSGGAILLSLAVLITSSFAPTIVASQEFAPYDKHQPSQPISAGYLA